MGKGIEVSSNNGSGGGSSSFADLTGAAEDNASLAAALAAKVSETSIIGEVFNEAWANLSDWTDVGTPTASVAAGRLSMAGTASLSTNYIRCSGYGNTNAENAVFEWDILVSTVGASASGIAFGLQGQSSAFANAIHVNIELSNSSTGKINWYQNNSTSVIQSSASVLAGITSGDTLYCKLYRYANRMVFSVTRNGISIEDTLYFNYPGVLNTPSNSTLAGQFAWYNRGGTHTIGNFSVSITDLSTVDLLVLGDSITQAGSSGAYQNGSGGNNRYIAHITNKYDAIVQCNGMAGAQCTDINTTEVSFYEAQKILVFLGTNDIAFNNLATAQTNISNLVTALGLIGYSTALGNLKFCTALPRGSADYNTFNTYLRTTFGVSFTINTNALFNDGTVTFPERYSVDATHPNVLGTIMIADLIAISYGYKIKGNTSGPYLYQGINPNNGHLGLSPLNTPFLTDLAAVAINATETATAARFASGLITSTSAAAVSITTPTAASLISYLRARQGNYYDMVIDNTNGANDVTIVLGVGFTQLVRVPDGGAGDLVVPSGAAGVGIFRIYFRAASAVISRIA